MDLCMAAMVGGFVGARLFHIVYEQPMFYWSHPEQIWRIWEGGYVFYGGFIGGFLAVSAVIKLKSLDFFNWADFFAPLLALGYALGRLACFLNGCCYGRACDLPWALSMPHLAGGDKFILRHPTQLYATFIELFIFLILIFLERKKQITQTHLNKWFTPKGQLFFLWMALHSLSRIFMEYFRADFRGNLVLNLSISTWISVIFLIAGLFIFFIRGRK